jgi:outer membrane protein OmpA-like peptidoglycan-associated protein
MRSFSRILLCLCFLGLGVLPAKSEQVLLRISFAPDEATLSTASHDEIVAFATELKNKTGRIELEAFAGEAGKVTSNQRRIALRRALVVRQLLLDQGIVAERMDVKALGGATGDTPLDRVDILQAGM